MKRIELAVLIGVILSVVVSSFSVFARESEQLRDEVLRLHIMPNSDSYADQQLKLAVRDAVLREQPELFVEAITREDALVQARERIIEIEQLALIEVSHRGYDYSVTADVVNMYFPTRNYEGFILPAGRYWAVSITIGSGGGQNWWCVIFPPMCIPAAQPPTERTPEEQLVRLGETPHYRPKFALVELIESLREK